MAKTKLDVPHAFVFMKVGNHAGETFEEILERKNKEFKDAGKIFWGYGGTACHPLRQVQPFARQIVEKHGEIHLLMQPVVSNADPDLLPATQYSDDGVTWKPMPKGIVVTGSRYALILNEIVPGDLDIVAQQFVVGVGPSRGRTADAYLKGRIDKACLMRGESIAAIDEAVAMPKQIKFTAKLQEPFAVMLK